MALACGIKEILRDENVIVPSRPVDSIILREGNVMEVEVVNLPPSMTAINITRMKHLSVVRDGPCRQICDYLLIFQLNGEDQAILIELKKTPTNADRAKEQLRRSLPILEYLRSACEIHCGTDSNEPRIATRYLQISAQQSSRLDKQRVKADPARRLLTEAYKEITVASFVGTRVPFSTLAKELY